ncbi:MAG: acetate--CoA ligase family protein, partial [Armatimonadota bacterium]
SFILQEGRGGHEVMIGAKRDPIFGFQIIFTPEGGKYAEIAAKAAPPIVRVGKIDLDEALSMIKEHPLSAIIMGARGEKPSDIESLAKLLMNISKLMYENPQVEALDLNPVFVDPDGVHLVDARIEEAEKVCPVPEVETDRSLSVFIKPKSAFAVIVSAKPNAVGAKLLVNLINTVGDVKVMLPTGKGLDNLQKMPVEIVDDVPEGCDLLVYAGIPADAPGIIKKFRERGGAGAVIISSDFAETGNKALEDKLKECAGEIPYVGPNGLGIYSKYLNTFFIDEQRTTYPAMNGKLALFTQSGSLASETFCEYLATHGIPVNAVFSLGNGSGITLTEILNSEAEDPAVGAIVIHLEGAIKEGEGPHFIAALKKATKVKPVIILPAGLSAKGRKSAASHTGRMTGGADALLAALKQGGAAVVTSEEQLRQVLWMLNVLPKAFDKTVIFTSGGGKGVLATDAAERIGLDLKEKLPVEYAEKVKQFLPSFADPTNNPFDFTAAASLDAIEKVLAAMKPLDCPCVFYYGYQVPGGTTTFKDGKAIGIDAVSAVDRVAKTIKEYDLPVVLHIIGQTGLARAVERKAEEHGVVVTRTSAIELILNSIKTVIEIWHKYPNLDLRTEWNLIPDTSLDCLKATE